MEVPHSMGEFSDHLGDVGTPKNFQLERGRWNEIFEEYCKSNGIPFLPGRKIILVCRSNDNVSDVFTQEESFFVKKEGRERQKFAIARLSSQARDLHAMEKNIKERSDTNRLPDGPPLGVKAANHSPNNRDPPSLPTIYLFETSFPPR